MPSPNSLPGASPAFFHRAKSIFLRGRATEPTCQAGFRGDFTIDDAASPVSIKLSAATVYRLFLNGHYVMTGPARAAHGMARVDTVNLQPYIVPGINRIAIEVVGYNFATYSETGDSSFLIAEVTAGENVLLATDANWAGVALSQRRRNVERFSHARCANELYDLDTRFFDWRTAPLETFASDMVQLLPQSPRFLPRDVVLPDVSLQTNPTLIGISDAIVDETIEVPPFSWFETPEYLKKLKAEHAERPAVQCYQMRLEPFAGEIELADRSAMRLSKLQQSAELDFDFGEMASGMVGIDFECDRPITIDLIHADRLLPNGRPDPRSCGCNSTLRLHARPGRYRFEAIDPNSFRYVGVLLRNAQAVTIHQVYRRRYQYPEFADGSFLCSDGELNRIYESARLTLRCNTLDVFMDCPGRERAGWLCDSLWSARAARQMLGDSSVERAMLEDFLHAPASKEYPGYFPSCYPGAPITGGDFINTWSMFLVIELAEYYRRTNDQDFVAEYKHRIGMLMDALAKSENDAGFLENLPGFTFIDWSDANSDEFKTPISTAANALYAMTLDAAELLYGNQRKYAHKAYRLRKALRQSKKETFFADALVHDGKGGFTPGKHSSEAAQYYLFWAGVADVQRDRSAWQALLDRHGPVPIDPPSDLALSRANLFIAQYIRFEVMAKMGYRTQLLTEIRKLFPKMIDRGPGTLWENLSDNASVCHGFASHVGVWLARDFLGLGIPDAINRTITISPHPGNLKWARGSQTVDNRIASLQWRQDDQQFRLTAAAPAGWTLNLHLPTHLAGGSVTLNGKPQPLGTREWLSLKQTATLEVQKNQKNA